MKIAFPLNTRQAYNIRSKFLITSIYQLISLTNVDIYTASYLSLLYIYEMIVFTWFCTLTSVDLKRPMIGTEIYKILVFTKV